MNQSRRSKLKTALSHLDSALSLVNSVCDEESDAIDNIPENLQLSDRYEKMENSVSLLEDAAEKIDSAADSIRDSM